MGATPLDFPWVPGFESPRAPFGSKFDDFPLLSYVLKPQGPMDLFGRSTGPSWAFFATPGGGGVMDNSMKARTNKNI